MMMMTFPSLLATVTSFEIQANSNNATLPASALWARIGLATVAKLLAEKQFRERLSPLDVYPHFLETVDNAPTPTKCCSVSVLTTLYRKRMLLDRNRRSAGREA